MINKRINLIVVKIGTSSLTNKRGEISSDKIKKHVFEAAELRKRGNAVIIVTSGSITAGYKSLGYIERPKTIIARQAAAAVGQGLLMEEYTRYLLQKGFVGAQLLLTRRDFADKRCYQNAYNAIDVLLKRNAIPIVNENDTVSIEELQFGDNDMLSAQVAGLVHANLLIMLTDIDGLYTDNPGENSNAKRITYVEKITPEIETMAGSVGSAFGTGGMRTKIKAAKIASMAGVPVFICDHKEENVMINAVEKKAKGTYFAACNTNLNTRLQWVAFHSDTKGFICVDDGAVNALEKRGKSLLPSGIIDIKGDFSKGDVVEVVDMKENLIGKGIVNYDSDILRRIKGLSSSDIQNKDKSCKTEAIHRDNWVGISQLDRRSETNN